MSTSRITRRTSSFLHPPTLLGQGCCFALVHPPSDSWGKGVTLPLFTHHLTPEARVLLCPCSQTIWLLRQGCYFALVHTPTDSWGKDVTLPMFTDHLTLKARVLLCPCSSTNWLLRQGCCFAIVHPSSDSWGKGVTLPLFIHHLTLEARVLLRLCSSAVWLLRQGCYFVLVHPPTDSWGRGVARLIFIHHLTVRCRYPLPLHNVDVNGSLSTCNDDVLMPAVISHVLTQTAYMFQWHCCSHSVPCGTAGSADSCTHTHTHRTLAEVYCWMPTQINTWHPATHIHTTYAQSIFNSATATFISSSALTFHNKVSPSVLKPIFR